VKRIGFRPCAGNEVVLEMSSRKVEVRSRDQMVVSRTRYFRFQNRLKTVSNEKNINELT
jgi:hypothetical protein